MNALTPLALTSEPLLRAIQAGDFANLKDLAEKSGRNKSNMARDLGILEEGGLISRSAPTKPELTPAAVEQLAAIERAGAPVVLHDQIEADPLNPRRVFHAEALSALADSIHDDGKLTLLQPLVIRPREGGPKPFRLVAGERRWRAIGLLIADGRWPAELPVPTSVRVLSDEEAAVLALVENMQREDLSAVDEALTFEHLRTSLEWSNADIAKHIKRTPEYVQQRLRVLKLDAAIQERMRLPKTDENRIGFKEARKLFTVSKEPTRPKAPELSPKLALALLELAHKVESAPMTVNAEPGFTVLTQRPTGGALATLNERKIVVLREWGGQVFAKVQLYTSGAVTYLEDIGFYGPKQQEVIWAARTAIMSPQRASEATRGGKYITPELNTELAAEQLSEDEAQEEADEPRPNNRAVEIPPVTPAKTGTSSTDRFNTRMHAERTSREEEEAARLEAITATIGATLEDVLPHAATAVARYDEAQKAGNEELAATAKELLFACVWKLNGKNRSGCEADDNSAGPLIRAALAGPEGEPPMWGLEGRFVLSVDGMTAGVRVKAGITSGCDFYIADIDAPFFSPTGYRSEFFSHHVLKTHDGAPLVVEVARIMRRHVAAHSTKRKPEPLDRESAARSLARETWVTDLVDASKVIDGTAAIEEHEAAVAVRLADGATNPVRQDVEIPFAPVTPSKSTEIRSAAFRIAKATELEIGLRPSWLPSRNFAWRLADDAFRSAYRGDVARFTAQFARLVAAVGESEASSELGRVFRRFGIDHKTLAMTLDPDSPNYEATHRDCYGVHEPDPNDPNKADWDDEEADGEVSE